MLLRCVKKTYYLKPDMIVRPAIGRKAWQWHTRYYFRKKLYWPFVALGGDWDRIDTVPAIAREDEMTDLFVRQLPYEETEKYKHLVAELKKKGYTRFPRTNSMEDIDAYFLHVRRVFENIKTQGYKTCQELGHPKSNEIHIRITRRGEFVKAGEGTHRLAMAKILNLPEVPVVIDLVHSSLMKKWKQECRDGGMDPLDYGVKKLKEQLLRAEKHEQ
jgi:hypothetical protein